MEYEGSGLILEKALEGHVDMVQYLLNHDVALHEGPYATPRSLDVTLCQAIRGRNFDVVKIPRMGQIRIRNTTPGVFH